MRVLLLASLVACGSGEPDEPLPEEEVPADLTFTDANNYGFTGEVSLGEAVIQAGADVTVDWCGLTTDLRGRPVDDPASVDQVLLIELDMTRAEAEAQIERNELDSTDAASAWLLLNPGRCAAAVSEFSILANPFDPAAYLVEDADRTWLLSVMNTPDGRFDILMSTALVPQDDATETVVTIDDDSSELAIDADLSSAEPLLARAGATPSIDWSDVTVDVYGAPFDDLRGNRLLLGKVPVDDVASAEAEFLRLDTAAETLYYLDVYGETQADLALATATDGAVFEGFTTDGIWLVGIECLTCTSPAPLLLTVVDVVE